MNEKTCSTCKHWDEPDYEYEHHQVRTCKFVPMLWTAFDWGEDGERVLTEKYKNRKAFAIDASDYHASLLTMAEFGCNQWDVK